MFANVSVMPALSDKSMKNVARAAFAGAVAAALMASAYAGADTTFSAATRMLTTWLGGSLGILISLATFATGNHDHRYQAQPDACGRGRCRCTGYPGSTRRFHNHDHRNPLIREARSAKRRFKRLFCCVYWYFVAVLHNNS
ncbi:MAG: hypothetical protein JVY19_00870 [Ferrovum myxofaciens]|uniref:hypothetical protein n=1 Tax=Ferrovum myxofaciens TaxID=416213 RepID=UPI001C741473|nr:hypothetical protein [Ferrovum myxofaciens]QWY75030.1 MAG: hypothetical protein JVY19_00870 [Ferrovum myxofaciens]